MLILLEIVLPVFLVVAAGYAIARFRLVSEQGVDTLAFFSTNIAIPCLLFLATYRLDLGAAFDPGFMSSFYAGAICCFVAGVLGARLVFGRRPGEAVSVGFNALFSNVVMMGLAIIPRAFGPEGEALLISLIAVHSPICYLLGISAMEAARRDGAGLRATLTRIARSLSRNALVMALAIGFALNASGLRLPEVAESAVDLVGSAGLPVALVATGGALARYSLRKGLGEAFYITGLSLILHPVLTWVLARHVFELSDLLVGVAVATAALPAGINGYIFATMYGRAQGTAASVVILATAGSIVTVTLWLAAMGATLGP
jgi:predicted permease